MTDDTKDYLGDGLYVSYDGYQIRLFASNGLHDYAEVFLDYQTLSAFLRYVDRVVRPRVKPEEVSP